MADYLVQRHIPNAPNETGGAWVDIGVVRDLKADEGQQALDATATPDEGRRRIIRWDTTEEYELVAAPPTFEPATKEAPDGHQEADRTQGQAQAAP